VACGIGVSSHTHFSYRPQAKKTVINILRVLQSEAEKEKKRKGNGFDGRKKVHDQIFKLEPHEGKEERRWR
jgi:hypothetical protein